MFAAGAGHVEAAKVLLDAGADVNTKLKATPEFLEQVNIPPEKFARVRTFVIYARPRVHFFVSHRGGGV